MLALAVVKKAANMSSIADSWERKEGVKFGCSFKVVVTEFSDCCHLFAGFVSVQRDPASHAAHHKPAPALVCQSPIQNTMPLFFHFHMNWPSTPQGTDADTQLR